MWFATAVWLMFVPLYFYPFWFLNQMGDKEPTSMAIFLIKVICSYCFFFGLADASVAGFGDRRANQALCAAQVAMALFFATVVYAIDIPQSKIPYYGTKVYYVVWASWIVSVIVGTALLAIDIKRYPLSQKRE